MAYFFSPKRKSRKKVKRIFILTIVFISLCAIALTIDARIRPAVKSMAAAYAKGIATRAIYDSLNAELEKENVSYEDLITLDRDANNRVTALRTNVVKINQLKAKLSIAALNKISSIDEGLLKIPLGNFINGELFSGRGPRISFKVVPVGSVTADMLNTFESGGINQTRLSLSIQIKAVIGILFPYYTASSEVTTTVPVAETIIVGEVPQNYINFNGDPTSILEKINNYVKN